MRTLCVEETINRTVNFCQSEVAGRGPSIADSFPVSETHSNAAPVPPGSVTAYADTWSFVPVRNGERSA